MITPTVFKVSSRYVGQLVFVLFLGCLNVSMGQNLEYGVFINGHPSGSSQVVKTKESKGSFRIDLSSSLNVHILVKIRLQFEGHAVFKDGILQKSGVTVYSNDHLRSRTETVLEHGTYQIIKDGKTLPPVTDSISYTGYNLYFTPPEKIRQLFSLSSGSMDLVEQTDTSHFEIIDSKGQKSTYGYNQKGLADYIKISHKAYDIEFKLKDGQ